VFSSSRLSVFKKRSKSAGKKKCSEKFYNILLHIDSASNKKGRGGELNNEGRDCTCVPFWLYNI